MNTQHFSNCGVDIEATRRQFLFAREQLAAHSPGARARVPRHLRLVSSRPGDDVASRRPRRIES
jgi:hypothetical protein